MNLILKSLATVTALSIAYSAVAGPVVAGFDASTVVRCDDCATASQSLGFSVNYFGNTYSSTFVSNNGYLTFNSGQSTYTPAGLGAGYSGQPIIAPFFADVDTRPAAGGTTGYGTGIFDGRNAFGVTWTDVGYFANHTDKTNTFQTLLVDRSDIGVGDFDIYFNYDRILWETGDASGGSNGFGGVSAAAGYNAGTGVAGSFGQLAGSLVNGALLDSGGNALVANSNIGVDGRYLFNVRGGEVTNPTPTSPAPEPATWSMMICGFGIAGGTLRRRKPTRAFIRA
jgi:hypothetical protein